MLHAWFVFHDKQNKIFSSEVYIKTITPSFYVFYLQKG